MKKVEQYYIVHNVNITMLISSLSHLMGVKCIYCKESQEEKLGCCREKSQSSEVTLLLCSYIHSLVMIED